MVLKPDIGRCASKEAEPRRGVDTRRRASKENGTSVSEDARPRRGWIVRSHIGWRGERNTLYKGVEISL